MIALVTIEKIIAGGQGLARPDNGKVVMVTGVLPGELVRVTKMKEHRGYIEAQLLEIITPSPARTEAICPWYQDCGGCDLQHCAYGAQLNIKKTIIREVLDRSNVTFSDHCPDDTLPSPEPFAYRYRLRMQIDKYGQIGFYKKGSNDVVPVTCCAVATAKINTVISFLQTSVLLKPISHSCRDIELLHSPADNTLTLLLHLKNKKMADMSLLAKLRNTPDVNQAAFVTRFRVYPHLELPLKQEVILSTVPQTNCSLSWSAGCFSQVNAGQNEQLIRLICQLVGDVQDTTLLDLYCGMGNFSIPLALQGATVTGIEKNPLSIKWARSNAETAGVSCSFYAADVFKSLQELAGDRQRVDTILLDPPRRGLGKAADLLPKLNPQQILYISCDPATLARDLAIICKQGYRLAELIPVDMFPQTHHIECVALLKKN